MSRFSRTRLRRRSEIDRVWRWITMLRAVRYNWKLSTVFVYRDLRGVWKGDAVLIYDKRRRVNHVSVWVFLAYYHNLSEFELVVWEISHDHLLPIFCYEYKFNPLGLATASTLPTTIAKCLSHPDSCWRSFPTTFHGEQSQCRPRCRVWAPFSPLAWTFQQVVDCCNESVDMVRSLRHIFVLFAFRPSIMSLVGE